MPKNFIKEGVPVQDLYDTVNDLTGMKDSGSAAGVTPKLEGDTVTITGGSSDSKTSTIVVDKESVEVSPSLIVKSDDPNVKSSISADQIIKNGNVIEGYTLVDCTVPEPLKSPKNFVLSLKSGPITSKFLYFVAPEDSGVSNAVKVEGTVYSAKYPNGQDVGAKDFVAGSIVTLILDDSGKAFFKGGGGVGVSELGSATATEEDVLEGKTFYGKGSIVDGHLNKVPLKGSIPTFKNVVSNNPRIPSSEETGVPAISIDASSMDQWLLTGKEYCNSDFKINKVEISGLQPNSIVRGHVVKITSGGTNLIQEAGEGGVEGTYVPSPWTVEKSYHFNYGTGTLHIGKNLPFSGYIQIVDCCNMEDHDRSYDEYGIGKTYDEAQNSISSSHKSVHSDGINVRQGDDLFFRPGTPNADDNNTTHTLYAFYSSIV